MNVNKVSGSGSVNPNATSDIKSEEKQNITNNYSGKVSSEVVSDLSKKATGVNNDKNKPVLNKNNLEVKGDIKGSSDFSFNMLCSLLTDFFSDEKLKFNSRAHGYNHKFLEGLWSSEKENQLNECILDSADLINDHIDAIADYYFSLMDGNSDLLEKMPDGELKNKLTGNGVGKFKNKSEIVEYLRKRTGVDEVIKNINTESALCKDKTKLFKSLSDELNKLPFPDDEVGMLLSGSRDEINAELTSLYILSGIQDDAKDILKDTVNLFSAQRKSDTNFTNSLTILMGKIADLRDKLAQHKLENDRLIATAQQKTLQNKIDADGAEMAEKIKKAERLQAIFKWLGPLLIALMAVLTALTGGLLAKALVAVVVIVTIISEIVKATGGPDIMAKIMTPVTKLVEVVQKFIKDMAMKIGQKLGLPPAELKKLEEKMEIIAMVLAVVVVMAMFAAAGAVAGKVIGQVASETVKEVLKQVMAEVKKLLITMMLTSTIVNGANSIIQAKLNEDVMKLNSDIDLDQELLDKLMALMEKIMAAFSESQQDLNKMKEQLGKIGKDDFQRKKSIIQSGMLAV
ncbi:type III secretion system translocon subunit SctE [Morganella morganii]|uniref:type III secretion system translocon subunit SctE n=1 Tax=Morganella morganii TaxID=582 RepID=UPI001161ED09|nr:type III secretion system translocon subunit SctE [Morganella morganii]QQO72213.1 type III secretion system translocon subunit SctE [Morganella morganii]